MHSAHTVAIINKCLFFIVLFYFYCFSFEDGVLSSSITQRTLLLLWPESAFSLEELILKSTHHADVELQYTSDSWAELSKEFCAIQMPSSCR